VPFLYNGEEIADENRHSIFANRYHGNGNTIDWSMALTEAGQKRTRIVRELCRIRHAHNALKKGRTVWVECDGEKSVLFFLRRSDEQCIGIYINMSSGMKAVRSNFRIVDENIILKKGIRNDSIKNGEIVFEQYGYLVFLVDPNASD